MNETQPYSDDTSDGSTAPTAQEIAEATAGQVKSTDDLAREAAGIEHPAEGHDVRDYRPIDTEASNTAANPGHPDYVAGEPTDDSVPDGTQLPEHAADSDAAAAQADQEQGDAGVPDPAPSDS